MEAILLIEKSVVFQMALRSVLRKLGFSVFLSRQHLRVSSDVSLVVLVDTITLSENPHQLESLVTEYSQVGSTLLLAREDHAELVAAGLRGGAVGFLKQTASPQQLKAAIRAVAAGRTWCDADLLRQVSKFLPSIPALRAAHLTKRELEVLGCIRSGQSNKEVAQHLGVTEQSVKVYVSNMLRKTGASNRHQLALAAAGAIAVP